MNEGRYRVMTHRDEDAKAIYLLITKEAAPTWVRDWKQATSFLTHAQAASVAREAQAREPQRRVSVIAQYQAWPKRRATQITPAPQGAA